MKKFDEPIYLLTEEEYKNITDPKKCYTFMTKSLANKLVKKLLKDWKFECWMDDKQINTDDFDCEECPVMKLLGNEVGERICTRPKYWQY